MSKHYKSYTWNMQLLFYNICKSYIHYYYAYTLYNQCQPHAWSVSVWRCSYSLGLLTSYYHTSSSHSYCAQSKWTALALDHWTVLLVWHPQVQVHAQCCKHYSLGMTGLNSRHFHIHWGLWKLISSVCCDSSTLAAFIMLSVSHVTVDWRTSLPQTCRHSRGNPV